MSAYRDYQRSRANIFHALRFCIVLVTIALIVAGLFAAGARWGAEWVAGVLLALIFGAALLTCLVVFLQWLWDVTGNKEE